MRRTLFKWHSFIALLAMVPLIVISITGSILVFKVEIDTWLMPENMQVSAQSGQSRVNLNGLISLVETTYPTFVLGSWELFDDKARSDTAYIINKEDSKWYKLYVDQYAGGLLSEPVSVTHDITDWLLSLHYTFLLGTAGTAVGFVFALMLLFLAVSGIILHRQFWKKLFILRIYSAKRILFSDVHKFIGILSSPVLLILAFTGAYWNASEVVHEATEHSGAHAYTKVALYHPNLDFQALIDTTSNHIPAHRPTYLTFPFEMELHISVFGDVPEKNVFSSEYSSVVTYDRQSGEVISAYDIRTATDWNAFVDMFRKLHFGYFAGLPSKIIWSILGLSPLWLALTGLYFYWFRKKRRRHA
ncbi:PepSY-associated TM helix domain-containing protein [Alteromonas sp. ASW11-130]|uniref:PepSY-associated TM helix domain-containing protein n=1 Tax=Alteromonas sp. ASW11-130 TaxID=3015775 RepID=UPI002241E6AF|nr:PepSY-associated TM helix domain-containing protein [Alteromonas sp. ASW11-130]MCW8091234.1 PepSY domain-containing protein [Alteromonas sp. ASW11-130]